MANKARAWAGAWALARALASGPQGRGLCLGLVLVESHGGGVGFIAVRALFA